jgi:2-dehydro-3-deoxyphosphooctonate aldolase (KDO 8-P synthase)
MTTAQHHIPLHNFKIGNDLPFTLIAGPCALESKDHACDISGALKEMTQKLGIPLIYKTSFDKANRTSLTGGRGLGLEKGLPILADIRKQMNLPIVTDVHTAEQCAEVAAVVDVLQIPAFLCRQTDLLVAAAKTGKIVNVKKGQFLAPWDMKNVAAKITESGNPNVMLCERGVTFGYNTLVNDMRALPLMAETGHPVVFDATHSVQQPGGAGTATSGDRRMVPYLARAAIAVGVAAVFIETHEDPDKAPSDGPNMMKLSDMPALLEQLLQIDRLIKQPAYQQAYTTKTEAA